MKFSSGQLLYLNPVLPFIESIQGGLQDGFDIIIKGIVLHSTADGNQFHVDFRCGTSGNDIAFHFNPRFFDGGYVECNTKQNGTWGTAERKPLPFQKGARFEIRFQVQSSAFNVTVNGNHFIHYPHRIPFQQVDTFMVNGIVHLAYICFQTLPFIQAIPGGLKDGSEFIIKGMVLNSSDYGNLFVADFWCGTSGNDIAFHFNPRFFDGGYVECNTKQNGTWGKEERRPMPFQKGAPFEIRYLIQNTGFNVFVNGTQFIHYPHRIPLHRVDTIAINGIVQLDHITFQGSTFPFESIPENTSAVRALISGGLSVGRSMLVCGSALPCADSFEINLRCGNDIAFHLKLYFEGNRVLRSSHLCDSWGSEEHDLLCPIHFIRGQAFTVWILCEVNCFKVTVNGHHLFNYNHRVKDLPSIKQLEVAGGIHLFHVQI